MSTLRSACVLVVVLSILTGVLYPLAITAIAQTLFPRQANGSLLVDEGGTVVGSALIGQEFTAPGHFWGRLSATAPVPYTALDAARVAGSAGSNLAPSNPELAARAAARLAALAAADSAAGVVRPSSTKLGSDLVPVDLVTASASGLDPHISLAAAEYQVPRVARARGLDEQFVRSLVRERTARPVLGALGEPTVDVLALNLALDRLRR